MRTNKLISTKRTFAPFVWVEGQPIAAMRTKRQFAAVAQMSAIASVRRLLANDSGPQLLHVVTTHFAVALSPGDRQADRLGQRR